MEAIEKVYEKLNEKIKELSPCMRASCKLLTNAIEQILAGECTEEEIAETMAALNPESKGYKREDDYVTIDKGMKLLGFGQNRTAFCNLMRKNGIVNEKFNTVPIGYNRQKILALKHKTEEEYQKRLDKERRKKYAKSCENQE